MGPVTILFLGMSLVAIPEAARVLERSPRHLPLFSLLIGSGLAVAALAWGVVLLVAMPRGLGAWLGPIWRPTYPLLLPTMLAVAGLGFSAGAGAGLHALGASRRSLRAAALGSAAYLACALGGAAVGGATGTVWGTVVSAWLGVFVLWWQLRAALRESGSRRVAARFWSRHPSGRHHKPTEARSR